MRLWKTLPLTSGDKDVRAVAACSYLGLLLLPALYAAREDDYIAFHANQGLTLLLAEACLLYTSLFCAVGLRFLLRERRSEDNRLILTVAMVLAVSGVCALLDVSPLLACMAMGAGYVNLTGDTRLFGQLDRFTPPILTLFFIVSGMNLNVGALRRFGMVGKMCIRDSLLSGATPPGCWCSTKRRGRPVSYTHLPRQHRRKLDGGARHQGLYLVAFPQGKEDFGPALF